MYVSFQRITTSEILHYQMLQSLVRKVMNCFVFCLLFTSPLSDLDDDKIIEFANRLLGPDGIHLLHFIRTHSGGQVASQIAAALFDAMSESYC